MCMRMQSKTQTAGFKYAANIGEVARYECTASRLIHHLVRSNLTRGTKQKESVTEYANNA